MALVLALAALAVAAVAAATAAVARDGYRRVPDDPRLLAVLRSQRADQ